MKICFIGTGYVGLVSGVLFSDFGNTVYCVDNNKKKTWELVINDLIKAKSSIDFHTTKKNYKNWYNVNKIEDYLKINKF